MGLWDILAQTVRNTCIPTSLFAGYIPVTYYFVPGYGTCFKLGHRTKEAESMSPPVGKAHGLEQSLLVRLMKHQKQTNPLILLPFSLRSPDSVYRKQNLLGIVTHAYNPSV